MTLGKAVFGRNKKGGEEFFSTKKGGRRLLFRKNKVGKDFFSSKKGAKTFFRQIFPKTRPKNPVNLDQRF